MQPVSYTHLDVYKRQVEGRELYLGVLGNKRLTVFPPREIFFGEPPQEDSPRFATAKAKWDDAYRKKWKIRNGPAGPLPQGLERRLAELEMCIRDRASPMKDSRSALLAA